MGSNNVCDFDLVLSETRNINDDMEVLILSLISKFRILSINNPYLNLTEIWQQIVDFIKLYENLVSENSHNVDDKNELQCELLLLRDKLLSEKESKLNVMNDSFKLQELSQSEYDSLKNDHLKLSAKVKLFESKCKDLINENTMLTERITGLEAELQKFKQKTVDLVSSRNSLLKKIEMSTTDSWNKRRWLDDDTIQQYVTACQENLRDRDDVLIIGPSLAHLVKLGSSDDVALHLDHLSLHSKKYVFSFVSNSSDGLTDDSASHWSLLMIDRTVNQAYHFDSANSINLIHAHTLSNKLGINVNECIEMPCGQQLNGYECGINSIVNLKVILNCYVLLNVQTPFMKWYLDYFTVSTVISTVTLKSQDKVVVPPTEAAQTKTFLKTHSDSSTLCTTNVESVKSICLKRVADDQWRVRTPKNGSKPKKVTAGPVELTLKNSFAALQSDETTQSVSMHVSESNIKKSLKKKSSIKKNQPNNVPAQLPSKTLKNDVCIAYKSDQSVNDKSNKSTPSSRKVLLLSDSHGRTLCQGIQARLGKHYKVTGVIKPNATFQNVIDGSEALEHTLNKTDYAVILAGTNNVPDHCGELRDTLGGVLSKLKNTNVLVLSIPKRFDEAKLNSLISDTNKILLKETESHSCAKFVSLDFIPRHQFTRHGLHFNSAGKEVLAELIVDAVLCREPRELPNKWIPTLKSNLSKNNIPFANNPVTKTHTRVWYNSKIKQNLIIPPDSAKLSNVRQTYPGIVTTNEAVRGRVWTNSSFDCCFLDKGWPRAQTT